MNRKKIALKIKKLSSAIYLLYETLEAIDGINMSNENVEFDNILDKIIDQMSEIAMSEKRKLDELLGQKDINQIRKDRS